MKYYSIILAAGKGTRMKSSLPKVLNPVLERSMINLVLDNLIDADILQNNIVVGYKKDKIIKKVEDENYKGEVNFYEQKEQLGTGHAILQVKKELENKEGITIIICGDTPLITDETIQNLIKHHLQNNSDLTILSANVENPTNYGRIIRDNSTYTVEGIVEEKDATNSQKMIKEINSGIYCVDNKLLFKYISQIKNDNVQKEYYLTDIVKIFKEKNLNVEAFKIQDNLEILGVNTNLDLYEANKILQIRINKKHLMNGVRIIDIENTYIGIDVEIGQGTIIYPNNYIIGKSKIGKNNVLKISNFIEDSVIGDDNQIGPMSYFRNNTIIENNTRIGNFVELKNTKFSSYSKAAHLTYLGDAEIGRNVNIGCGVITANYDGVKKHKTIIEDDVFIGSNSNLIAPLKIRSESFIAAGTTVTRDVDKKKFVIGRVREEVKPKKS